MGKKTKSKDRLDKFYRFAKEQGYRSRAAFKLIQLNKKHNFLEKATILVDLCAAPGGWLQVASKQMASASIIIGVDLDPIKSIPNVKTFVADITTQRCMDLIRSEIKHMKVDVVLNDGAPNVGANWNMDAYTQSELVMHSLKLATQVLKKGGVFVTKIFRSADYLNLIWLFNKFFDVVEASKPEASRTQSAEIFVVCSKYKSPDYIDPKFFEPKWVFKNTEGDFLMEMSDNNVNSIRKIFETKRRTMIKDDSPNTMFKKIPLSGFVGAENPYFVFSEFNAIDISDENCKLKGEAISEKKFGEYLAYPEDFVEMCKDLKLLSKTQVGSLIKWRAKLIQTMKNSEKKNAIKQKKEKEVGSEGKVEEEKPENHKGDVEYKEMKKEEKSKEKLREKQMYKFVKTKLIANNAIVGQENEAELADFQFGEYQNEVRKGRYQELEQEEGLVGPQKKEKLTSYAEMCDNIEYLYEQKMKKEMEKSGQHPDDNKKIVSDILSKKIKKTKKELPKTKKGELTNKKQVIENAVVDFDKLKATNKWFDKTAFDLVANQEAKNEDGPIKKVEHKPEAQDKKKKKTKDNEEDESEAKSESEVDEYDDLDGQRGPDLRKMNDDDLAEMIVLSKKMLRKKTRREIIDASYNRFNYPEDPSTLPKWFVDDERKHTGIIPQITKVEVDAEKERLYLMKNQLPKKVQEAKHRKKKKVIREMKKAEGEVKQIFEEDNLNFSKAKQISEIYKRAIRKGKEKPKNIVFMKRQFSGAPRKKSGRKFLVVDKRGKKDFRNDKFTKKGHN